MPAHLRSPATGAPASPTGAGATSVLYAIVIDRSWQDHDGGATGKFFIRRGGLRGSTGARRAFLLFLLLLMKPC
jgi:hypothetical protein